MAFVYMDFLPEHSEIENNFHQFADRHNVSDVYFTSVNIFHTSKLNRFSWNELPRILIIRGKEEKWWESIQTDNWELYFNWTHGPAAHYITNRTQLTHPLSHIFTGLTTFELVITKKQLHILEEYKNHAERYSVYGNRFIYRIKPKCRLSLRAYHSLGCKYKLRGNIKNFGWFFEKHRFNSFHNYAKDELEDLYNQSIAMYVSDNVQKIHYESIDHITQKHCHDFFYGFTSEDLAPGNRKPYLFAKNSETNCSLVWNKTIIDSSKRGFLGFISNSTKCANFTEGVWIRKNQNKQLIGLISLGFSAGMIWFIIIVRSYINEKYE